jgi:uncharacterized coiled-coil protein SlyX
MLASMLGLKPEQMKAMVEGMTKAATEGVETLQRIEAKLDALNTRLEAVENGNRE